EPGHNCMWQIAILPLDANIKPYKGIIPFYMDMQIKRPENINDEAIKLAKVDWAIRQQRAVDPWTAGDMFDEWFQSLGLPMYKRLVPLAQNWPFDREFIIDWLGRETFSQLFSVHYRDTMAAALFRNDCADFKNEKIPIPKVNLNYLGTVFGVKNYKAHDALQDCIVTAEIYRRIILGTV
ncbi:hypothetical protein LCGC14_1555270, partial [marine sediment metagenome]